MGRLLAAGVIAAASAALVALILLPLLILVARKFGLVDTPSKHKRHKTPTPVLGGAGLFVSFWVALLICSLAGFELQISSRMWIGIAIGSLFIFSMGQTDDLRPLPAWLKLVAQIAAGLALVWGDLSVTQATLPFSGESLATGLFGSLITVVWVVALCNAINLIDGIDLLAAGVSMIAALVMATIGLLHGVAATVVIASALVGFCVVFVSYNRPPAKLFLGDAGAHQLGFYFAVLSLVVPFKSFTAAALYLPLLALLVPLLEMASSFVRRVVAGKNPLKADRRHLFHYLAYAGLNNRQILLIFYSATALCGLGGILFYLFDRSLAVTVLLVFLLVAAGLIGIFGQTRSRDTTKPVDPSEQGVE